MNYRTGYGNRHSRALEPYVFGAITILGLIIVAGMLGRYTYNNIIFGKECKGYLKRATDATSVEMAQRELETALNYMDQHGLTRGYTSIIYQTPDEDVGFWYTNLSKTNEELKEVLAKPKTTKLEKSNILMKLREAVLDENGQMGLQVTVPSGIAVYPNNTAYAVYLIIGFGVLVAGISGLASYMNRNDSRSRGITLIELCIVIAIIMTIAGVLVGATS